VSLCLDRPKRKDKPISFDDINKIIDRGIAAENDVSIGDLVLCEDSSCGVFIEIGLRHHETQVQASFILFAEGDVGRLFVETDSKALDFSLHCAASDCDE